MAAMPWARVRSRALPAWLALVAVAAFADAAGPMVLTDGGVSQMCSAALREYLLCGAVSGLFSVCHQEELFESSQSLQILFDCQDNPRRCSENCMLGVARVTNESVRAPCSAGYQAMHAFGAPLNIFTVGQVDEETNATHARILPLPNIKGLGGPSLISYGEPAHCAEVPSAQYCVLSGELSMQQADPQMKQFFAFGTCLPKDCLEEDLRYILAGQNLTHLSVGVQCDLVRPVAPAVGTSAIFESKLGWGGVPVYYPSKMEYTGGFVATMVLIVVLAALVCAGTAIDVRREGKRVVPVNGACRAPEAALPLSAPSTAHPPRATGVLGFLNHWSLLRNGRSLLKARPREQNEFASMDAIRVFSMAQVILGHSFLYVAQSAGYSNIEQFSPPHGLLGSFWFQVIPGCFYGVDSFFVMSGFFCAYGLQKKVFNRRENRRPGAFSLKYLQFAMLRWLRLIPAEMFCMAFIVNVLPLMGTGILWNTEHPDGQHCFDHAGAGQCSKYWWVNLLFLQDLDKYLGKCMSHTWYLANDFQLYLTAPFFALAYGADKRLGWTLLAVCLAVGVALPMVMTAQHEWVPELLAGGTKGYMKLFYMKPWCRCPPFLIGIAAGWAWPWLRERYGDRPVTLKAKAFGWIWSVVGVGLCGFATFGRMAFWQCDYLTCMDPQLSPVPRSLQYLWAGFSIAAWCLGLAIIMILCFLGRFLPLWQSFMHLPLWQPIAKLSYSTYLIHTAILILDFCQRDSQMAYSPFPFAFNFVAFTVCSLLAALVVYLLVEKPATNLQMKVFGAGGD